MPIWLAAWRGWKDLLEELGASLSLLHTKMAMIIGQLVAAERRTTQSEQMLNDDFRPEDTTP